MRTIARSFLVLALLPSIASVSLAITNVEIVPVGDLWAAKSKVGSRDALLLIDTGSPRSVLFRSFHSAAIQDSATTREDLLLGSEKFPKQAFNIRSSTTRDEALGISGILGTDVLRNRVLYFDFYKRKLAIARESERTLLAADYRERRKELYPKFSDITYNFEVDKTGYPVFRIKSGQRVALDTGSGGVFMMKSPGIDCRSIGIMEINLHDKAVKREVHMCANMNILGMDLGLLFQPLSLEELPDGIEGTVPINDSISPIFIFDFASRILTLPDLDRTAKRLVAFSKWFAYSLVASEGKLFVGPFYESDENKVNLSLVGKEIVALGDFTGKEILDIVLGSDSSSLSKVWSLVERRKSDMVMLVRSNGKIMRGKLVGTERRVL